MGSKIIFSLLLPMVTLGASLRSNNDWYLGHYDLHRPDERTSSLPKDIKALDQHNIKQSVGNPAQIKYALVGLIQSLKEGINQKKLDIINLAKALQEAGRDVNIDIKEDEKASKMIDGVVRNAEIVDLETIEKLYRELSSMNEHVNDVFNQLNSKLPAEMSNKSRIKVYSATPLASSYYDDGAYL